MKKISQVLQFVGSCDTFKRKVFISLWIIKTLIELPAFLYHELMHILFILFTFSSASVNEAYFYEIKNNENKTQTLSSYQLSLNITAWSNTNHILVAIAPLIGWIILIICAIATSSWFLLGYCFFCCHMFFLSGTDIKSLRSSGLNERLCNVFESILIFVRKIDLK